MKIMQLGLRDFRSYKKYQADFGEKTIVTGPNGSGKSNLMEAIYLLAVGKSFRADSDFEMINYREQFANAQGSILGAEYGQTELKVLLTNGSGLGRKKFEVNGVPKRMMDFVGRFRAVLFGPSDLELVTGRPSERRRYLDFVLSQTDREYHRCLLSYEKGLRQRNKLLDLIREGTAERSQLWFWDRLLVKNGEYLTGKRGDYLNELNIKSPIFNVQYDKSVISEVRLKQYEVEEVAAGSTLVGPHRDDFQVMQTLMGHNAPSDPPLNFSPPARVFAVRGGGGSYDYKDVSKYGSRGEQRMAVLWLKLGELKYLSDSGGDPPYVRQPVLLLDDVFSELDHEHRKGVLTLVNEQIGRGGQVIMSTADEHLVPIDGWEKIDLGGDKMANDGTSFI